MCAVITLCIVENNQWKEVDCGRRSMVLLDYGMAPKALFMCLVDFAFDKCKIFDFDKRVCFRGWPVRLLCKRKV